VTITFYIAAGVAVASTLLVILGINAVHSLLYLVVSLLSVAVVFFSLGAPFASALEVIVYAGAIMVLFVFVIMTLNQGRHSVLQEGEWFNLRVLRGPAFLTAILAVEMLYILSSGGGATAGGRIVGAKEVSVALFRQHSLLVEMASVLLLAGLVGAYHLGRRGPAGQKSKKSR
jgi:NADH-quinone oxidoreductase subunit J